MPEAGAVPGAVIAIQSFSDFMGFNPHLHVLGTDGCFYGEGMFKPALARLIGFEAGSFIFVSLNDPLLISRITRSGPGVAHRFDTRPLEEIFRHKIFKMLLLKGKITQELVDMLMSWRHSLLTEGQASICLLWPQDPARRGRRHGKPGPVYHPGLILPGADDIFP